MQGANGDLESTGGQAVRAQGIGWGIYEDAVSDPTFPVTVWDGMPYTAAAEDDVESHAGTSLGWEWHVPKSDVKHVHVN